MTKINTFKTTKTKTNQIEIKKNKKKEEEKKNWTTSILNPTKSLIHKLFFKKNETFPKVHHLPKLPKIVLQPQNTNHENQN